MASASPSIVGRAILDDRALATQLVGMMTQGSLQALSGTCRRWGNDAYRFAPDACRMLVRLMSWALEQPASGGSMAWQRLAGSDEQSARAAWRQELLESIRLGCQDSREGGDCEEPFAGAAGSKADPRPRLEVVSPHCGPPDWCQQNAFRDMRISDDELCAAMNRGSTGDVRRLILCSSRLTDRGILQALGSHWSALEELCLVGGFPIEEDKAGESTPRISATALAPLVELARQRGSRLPLRTLILVGIVDAPLAALLGACPDLETVMVQGRLSTRSIEALSKCPRLRTLRLSLTPRVLQDPFVKVFKSCRQLRHVDIYRATNASDQLLQSLMRHTAHLEEFSGARICFSSALSLRQPTEWIAFKAHFSKAKIILDDLATDSLL